MHPALPSRFAVLALLLACMAARAHADKEFKKPTWKSFRADWCGRWASNCGQSGADEFCKASGFPAGAASFKGPVQISSGKTVLPATGQTCNPSHHRCDTFSSITCREDGGGDDEDGGGITIQSPEYKGLPLDHCLDWETACGAPAANYYCQLKGYKGSPEQGPSVPVESGGTVLPKSGSTCDPEVHVCGTFEYVVCA